MKCNNPNQTIPETSQPPTGADARDAAPSRDEVSQKFRSHGPLGLLMVGFKCKTAPH
jgi:hypothetical protein